MRDGMAFGQESRPAPDTCGESSGDRRPDGLCSLLISGASRWTNPPEAPGPRQGGQAGGGLRAGGLGSGEEGRVCASAHAAWPQASRPSCSRHSWKPLGCPLDVQRSPHARSWSHSLTPCLPHTSTHSFIHSIFAKNPLPLEIHSDD